VRYTLLLQNFTWPTLSNITMNDDLGAQNTSTAFLPGSLTLASTDLPAGTYTVCSTCGTNGAGTISISGLSIVTNQQYQIQFDVTLASTAEQHYRPQSGEPFRHRLDQQSVVRRQ
jgi:hypothetical protein